MFVGKYSMSMEQNIFFAKRNIVDYIWKSANLEGIGVTYPDTQAIYNGMSVAGYTIDEINAVTGLKHAWNFLLDNITAETDLAFIKKVHLELGKFTIINSGCLRRDDVHIGGTEWIPAMPDEKTVTAQIADILNRACQETDRALDMMLYLMRAQLFYDGNKRLAMLIGNKLMIQNGLGVISVKQKDIQGFYSLLIPYYETNEPDRLKKFIYDNCIDGMNFSC